MEIYVIILIEYLRGVIIIKKNFYKVVVIVSIFVNFILLFYIIKEKLNRPSTWANSTNEESNKSYLSYIFMNNPVDEYFSKKFEDLTLSEIEIKTYQEDYLKVWKNIYDNIMNIIHNKCIYEEDIAKYNNFIKEINNCYENIEPLLLLEMLNNYSIPESPEKYSYGTGTADGLKMYKGMIYRNACMLFIPYLVDEYQFPNNKDIELYINN